MVVDGESSIDLWHKRMGHRSKKVLRALPCVNSTSHSCNIDDCDVCFRAHHPRTSYPKSNSRASRIFKLIHCDLWGASIELSQVVMLNIF